MTSPVEFSTGEFRAKLGMKNPLKWHKQPGRIFRKSNTNPGKQFGVSKCLDSCGPDLSLSDVPAGHEKCFINCFFTLHFPSAVYMSFSSTAHLPLNFIYTDLANERAFSLMSLIKLAALDFLVSVICYWLVKPNEGYSKSQLCFCIDNRYTRNEANLFMIPIKFFLLGIFIFA